MHRLEDQHAQAVVEWAGRHQYRWPALKWLLHVANEGTGSKARGARMKAAGVKPGVHDYFLPVPIRGAGDSCGRCGEVFDPPTLWNGLWLELKVEDNHLTPDQVDFRRDMRAAGYAVTAAWGVDEAIEALERYLTGNWDGAPTATEWRMGVGNV